MLGYFLVAAVVTHGAVVIKRRMNGWKKEEKVEEHEVEEHEVVDAQTVYYVKIPNFAVSSVIGKRGCMLRKIMNETQTDCKVINVCLDKSDTWKTENTCEDWFENDKKSQYAKYLAIRTSKKAKLELVKLRIDEIVENVKHSLKTIEFPINASIVGFVVGKGGKGVRKLAAEFNCCIQISQPLIDNPSVSIVTINGRDLESMEQAKLVICETRFSNNSQSGDQSGCYDDVQQELKDLAEARRFLEKS